MWSFPTRISSSCLPTIFFLGQLVSSSLKSASHPVQHVSKPTTERDTHLVISLDSMIRLSSFTTRGPTHTIRIRHQSVSFGELMLATPKENAMLTLFADQTIVPVVRVVRIPQTSVGVLKLQELVPVLARMSCAEARSARASARRGEGRDLLVSERGRGRDISPAHA